MKAVRIEADGSAAVVELPEPAIGAGEALMRTRVSGICGSDLLDWYVRRKAGTILGHEVSGEIVALGAGVAAFRAGDRVAPQTRAASNAAVASGAVARAQPGRSAPHTTVPTATA